MSWFLGAFRKYATFSGRARRSEYWYFILFYLLIYAGLLIASVVADSLSGLLSGGLQLLAAIFSLGAFIPSLAVSVRRLHDTDRSGWWFLIVLVPLIGGIVLFIFFVQDSQAGENRFGPNPKGNADAKGGGAASSGGVSMGVIAAVVGVFAVFVVGIVAAVALPAYQDYQARAIVAQGVSVLAGFKPQIAELAKRKDSTASLASAGISLPGKDILGGIYYDPKTLTLVGNLADPFTGRSIGLQLASSGGDSPNWICGSKNLEMKYLPSSCQRQVDYLDEREALAFQRVAPAGPVQAATEAKAPATPQAQTVPAVASPVAPAVSPPQAEIAPPKTVAPAPVAASTAKLDARERARPDAETIVQRRAAILREQEAQRRLKPKQGVCVYKPIMTDEDLANCR